MKVTTTVMLGVAALALTFSACGSAATNTTNSSTTNSTTTNSAGQSNSARTSNSNQTATSNTATSNTASNTARAAADKAEGDKIEGELQVGKTESVILYVGKESGDYAGYCFTNDSEEGRAILAACKDRAQCEVVGKIDYGSNCKVPGLEADLSASGRILKVSSAKSLGGKK